VITAMSGEQALAICERAECDLVLLDVMMPDLDGFEVCRRLKTNPATHHIPVIMVTALDQPADRVRGLEAGADDFLTKPIPELALIAGVRSLARLKMITDELRMRAVTSREIGMESPDREAVSDTGRGGRVLIVDDRPASHERIAAMLAEEQSVDVEADPSEALFRAADGDYDLLIVSLGLENFDALRLCSQIRSLDRTRNMPILAITEPDSNARMVRGLEIGVNDYLMRPIDKNELLARARSQVRKRRYTERLRDNVQISIEMAITDALTGLFNRRYMESHLAGLLEQASARGKPLAVLVIDIDYFKSINDTHGHDAGDEVRAAHQALDTRHRFGLPLRRRGVRGGHARDRHGGRRHGGGAAAPPHRGRAVCDPRGCAQHSGDDLDRHRRLARSRRQRRRRSQARRSGALSRQA
jgi:two-component system, cell cycle response regulator